MNATNKFDITFEGAPVIIPKTDGSFTYQIDNSPNVDQFSPEIQTNIRRRVMISFIE